MLVRVNAELECLVPEVPDYILARPPGVGRFVSIPVGALDQEAISLLGIEWMNAMAKKVEQQRYTGEV